MQDPDVKSLRYRLKTDSWVEFDGPPPLEREEKEFRVRLEDGEITVELKVHHATPVTARSAIDQWLRAWQVRFRTRLR